MIFTLENTPTQLAGPGTEVVQLQALQAAGLVVTPTLVLLGLEAEFYQLGNLGEQIKRAFEGVFGARLDEEKLERACKFAQRLLLDTYMLPERSDEIRAALPDGPLLVRYAGEPPFGMEVDKQETLWAHKRLWASRWQLDAVLERQPELAPPEAACLVQSVWNAPTLDETLSAQATLELGQSIRVWACSGRIVRVG